MNVEKNIKLLLLKLNRQGKEVSLIRINRYSQEYDSISTFYKLTFWKKVMRRKRGGGYEEKKIPDTYEFKDAVELLKFMVVRANE